MADIIISPNMNLPVPIVGQDAGPDYADNINNSLTLIDQHNHSSGQGVQIGSAGLNITTDLTINSANLTTARSVRFAPQASPIAASSPDLGCLYESGVDLYYNDGSGNQVRITQSGGVAGSPGSIANLTSPASASYVALSSTFVWQSAANTPANMDNASVILRNLSASSKGLTLSPPSAMAADFTITLPSLPAAVTPVTIDASGNMGTSLIGPSLMTTAAAQALNPPGTILMTGRATAASGYIICDGSAISRSTYSDLFTAISTAYGSGDGSTTFNVPDMRGVFPRGVTGASGRDPDASSRTASGTGGNTGNNVGSYEADAFQSHTHGIPDDEGIGGVTIGAKYVTNANAFVSNLTSFVPTGNISTETRPKNVYVNFMIKT